jgi:hypothetical protein
MGFRVSFFWKQQAELEGGWSENYWADGVTSTQLVTYATTLRNLFNQVKGFGVWCPKFRISNPDVFRSGFNTRFPGAAPATGAADRSADYFTTKWQIKQRCSAGTVTQWFGGCEDISIVRASLDRASTAISRNWADVVAELQGAGRPWRLRMLDPTVLPIPVLTINPETGLVTVGAHNFLTNDRVRISRINGLTDANGIWRVINATSSTTSFSLAGWIPSTQVYSKSPSAQVRLQKYAYQSITNISLERATSHKVGKPTDLLGGRRKKRKK